MLSADLQNRLKDVDESEKIHFLINKSLLEDNDWDSLHNLNESICINLATSFSGIGAPEHALDRLGLKHRIVFAGDIDEFCKKTYFANYKITDVNWHNDIRQFCAVKYNGLIDLFVGGSPCQSFSIGGKRKGLEESRGTLFYEYARLIKESNPKVFIYENVTGLLNHDKGKTWKVVCSIFDELGYNWTYWILNSKNYGIPQNRKRVYVIGFKKEFYNYFERLSKPSEKELSYEVDDLLQSNIPNKFYLPQKGFDRVIDPKHNRHVALNSKISRTQIANQQYNWYGDIRIEFQIPQRLKLDERIYKGIFNDRLCVARCLTPRECLRLMGYEDSFKIVVNDQQQYKQSGNSIVVNVLMEIIKSIIKTGVFYGK